MTDSFTQLNDLKSKTLHIVQLKRYFKENKQYYQKEKTLHLVVPSESISDLMTLYKQEVLGWPLPHTCFVYMTRTKGQTKLSIAKAT